MLGGLLGALAIFFIFVANNPMTQELGGSQQQILTYAEGSPDTLTGTPASPEEPPPAIYVMKDGNVFLGDRPISRATLETLLADARADGRVISFARDSAGDDASDVQQEIFGLVKESGTRYELRDIPPPVVASP